MSRLHRRGFIKSAVALGAASALIERRGALTNSLPSQAAGGEAASSVEINGKDFILRAPENPDRWGEYRERLKGWRQQTRERLKYDDSLYDRRDFAWVQSSFSCCFLMMSDETFYDAEQGRYTAEKFLDHGEKEFGGYDGVVLWHAYPRIGLDDRNQFDFYRDMPGGLGGLKELTRIFHTRGVKVFIDYNPWDTSTRREGVSDVDALMAMLSSIDADGIFLDTMNKGAAEFRHRLDAVRPGLVLEGEVALPLENIHDHHMSWAQWFKDSYAPGVLRNKWFERRHMQHQIDRFNRDHTPELHTAWMNGSGMMVWENVFGTWVGWNERDRSIFKSMLPIQRRYVSLFTGEGWMPLVQTLIPDVFASLWEADGLRLWTIVNRSEKPVEGALLDVKDEKDARYFDLIAGREMKTDVQHGQVKLHGAIRPRGIGAFLSGTQAALGGDFAQFLTAQARLHKSANWKTDFPWLHAQLRPVKQIKKYMNREMPAGMAEIAPAKLNLKMEIRIREVGFYESQSDYFNGTGFHALHKVLPLERQISLSRYAIDLTPVTNAQFSEFLKATQYKPKHTENFLKHWRRGAPPPGGEDHPVVYVDLSDARAYAQWSGKRLPTEEEWQYAAQGPAALRYPWGNYMKPGVCNGGESGGTTSVTAFPEGRSPFGLYDMCGNTWEWTESERSDGRNRFCMIRGGSYYHAKDSGWYMDGGPQPTSFTAKFLLMWPGLERCATIGFRCVADLEEIAGK